MATHRVNNTDIIPNNFAPQDAQFLNQLPQELIVKIYKLLKEQGVHCRTMIVVSHSWKMAFIKAFGAVENASWIAYVTLRQIKWGGSEAVKLDDYKKLNYPETSISEIRLYFENQWHDLNSTDTMFNFYLKDKSYKEASKIHDNIRNAERFCNSKKHLDKNYYTTLTKFLLQNKCHEEVFVLAQDSSHPEQIREIALTVLFQAPELFNRLISLASSKHFREEYVFNSYTHQGILLRSGDAALTYINDGLIPYLKDDEKCREAFSQVCNRISNEACISYYREILSKYDSKCLLL